MPVYTKWNAAHEMFALNETLEQVMDLVEEFAPRRKSDSFSTWTPAADMYETESAVVLHIELTGIDRHALELVFREGSLVLRGRRSFSSEMQSAKILRIERMYGVFQRSFWIPVSIDSQHITASYENGVLYIRLLKRQQDESAQVHVPITFI
jgi:HSP20 family protein